MAQIGFGDKSRSRFFAVILNFMSFFDMMVHMDLLYKGNER